MYCVTLTTGDPNKLLSALRKQRVNFKVEQVRKEGFANRRRPAEESQRIYDLVARDGLTYMAAAARAQVSYHTVVRIIQNPSKYGVKGPPIRRL